MNYERFSWMFQSYIFGEMNFLTDNELIIPLNKNIKANKSIMKEEHSTITLHPVEIIVY